MSEHTTSHKGGEHLCRPSQNPRNPDHCACGRRLEALDPRTARDPISEREFLRGAEKLAGLDMGWSDRVAERVARLDVEHGERYRTFTVARLLREIEEEAFDFGGWPMLLALRLNGADLDDDTLLTAKMMLQEIGAYGVRGAGLVERLRGMLL